MDKIFVTKSSLPSMSEYMDEIQDIWDSHWLTNMGKKHEQLRKELVKYLEVENVELLTNGHMALELSLQAMGLVGEVITTPFTFASTTHAIVRNNLQPVFCDINDKDYTIDTTKIESLITDKTCAIVPVHVYGNVCNVEEIDCIAKKYGLKVIYDAAHAFGVKYKGIGIGNYGDASCFSFHATKVFNTIEGGGVCYNDLNFGEKLYKLKNFGIKGPEEVDGVGANAKMNEFCAAMGICNIRHIDSEIQKRSKVVKKYTKCLNGVDGIGLMSMQKEVETNYAYFPIVVDENKYGLDREQLYQILADNNIFTRKYFYPLTNAFTCFEKKYDVEKTPIAFNISKRVLTLPLYADLPFDIVEYICEIIRDNKK